MYSEPNKPVLVTGGRGFIGRAVVKLLQRSGYPVISVDRGAVEESKPAGEEVQCDLVDADCLRRLFEDIRISSIVHLAAILPTAAQRNPLLATQVNICGSANLLEMARQFGIQRFVFGSSLSIYGTYPAERVVSEVDATLPEDLYGTAKLYIEQLGRAYRECYGLDFVSLRIGRVVGPGANSTTSAWRSEIFELLNSDHPAEIGLPYRSSEKLLVIHVEDVTQMFLALLSASRTEHSVYNAPCSAVVVEDLKRTVENLNSKLTVRAGEATLAGNPQALDFSRFQKEFDFEAVPVFDHLRNAAGK
jgi:nucleoside-diphosphate-sugar epimerase